jgi:hypothetical protein
VPRGVADYGDALKARDALAEGGGVILLKTQLQDFIIIASSGFVVAGVAIWLVWLSRRHRALFPNTDAMTKRGR